MGLGAGQDDGAHARLDGARIGHLGRHQRRQPALADRDLATVLDPGARTGRLIEHHLPGHEVAVADPGGGHHQPGGIDLRALMEQHPRLIDDHHLAIGLDAPGDFRRIGSHHPVQRHRRGRGLAEIHRLRAADIEALPVHRRALAGLGDRGRGLGLRDARLSAHDHAPRGLRIGRQLRARGVGRRRRGQHGQRHRLQGRGLQQSMPAEPVGETDAGESPGTSDRAIHLFHHRTLYLCSQQTLSRRGAPFGARSFQYRNRTCQ